MSRRSLLGTHTEKATQGKPGAKRNFLTEAHKGHKGVSEQKECHLSSQSGNRERGVALFCTLHCTVQGGFELRPSGRFCCPLNAGGTLASRPLPPRYSLRPGNPAGGNNDSCLMDVAPGRALSILIGIEVSFFNGRKSLGILRLLYNV
jgi:hypothetical protein